MRLRETEWNSEKTHVERKNERDFILFKRI